MFSEHFHKGLNLNFPGKSQQKHPDSFLLSPFTGINFEFFQQTTVYYTMCNTLLPFQLFA